MSKSIRTILAAGVAAIAAAGCASVAEGGQEQVLVVLGGQAAQSPALIEQAREAVENASGAQVQLRVPQTVTDELGVTHMAAARHYDAIIAVDLDKRVAVDPVAKRYPQVRFVATPADGDALARALAAIAR
jgi:basic membrane lipoprotein Med (substrate-binding protein (PBP1-ABC) superfamily)